MFLLFNEKTKTVILATVCANQASEKVWLKVHTHTHIWVDQCLNSNIIVLQQLVLYLIISSLHPHVCWVYGIYWFSLKMGHTGIYCLVIRLPII